MMAIDNYISKNWRVSLALILIFMAVLIIYARSRFEYWKKRGIPDVSMRALPVFGHTFKLLLGLKSVSETFSELYAASGENGFAGFFQGKHPCLLVKDPDLIRNILVADFPIFADRAFAGEGADPLETRQLFHLQGRKWKEMRMRLNPMFSSGRMEAMFPLMNACAENMLEHLRKETDDGEGLVEIKELLSSYLIDVIMSCVFGIQSDALISHRNSDFLSKRKKLFQNNWRKGAENLFLNVAPGLSKLTFRRAPDEASAFIYKTAREAIERKEQAIKDERQKGSKRGATERGVPSDFADSLVALKNSEDGLFMSNLNQDDLTAQAMMFFSAGFETTLALLSSVLLELSSSKEGIEIQQKLRQEIIIATESDGTTITYDSLKTMELLDRVLSETLRLHSPTAVLSRKCNAQYWIPKTKISLEKGTRIFIPVHSLHNDPKYFPNPEKFDPDRFLPEQKRPHYVYLPFGGGPRICMGLRFAFIQAQLVLSTLLSKFEFELHHEKSKLPSEFSTRSTFFNPEQGIWLKVMQLRKKCRRNAFSHKDLEHAFSKINKSSTYPP